MADKEKSLARQLRTIGALSTVGFSFVLAVVIGVAFGMWLDSTLGTSPWLFLLFAFLGIAAGIVNVYRISSKFLK